MIVPDINVLVYAYNVDMPEHTLARAWWEQALKGPRAVGMPWVTILGFLRITTQRRIFGAPLRPAEAIGHVRDWLAEPHVQILAPGEGHSEILFGLLEKLGVAGDLTTDAHLAALAIEYQAELVTTDSDFARFPRLRWFNPLALK